MNPVSRTDPLGGSMVDTAFTYLPDSFNDWFGGSWGGFGSWLDCMGSCLDDPCASNFWPSGIGLPGTLLPKRWFPTLGKQGSPWTTPISVLRTYMRPLQKYTRVLKWMRRLSKWSPYVFIADGAISWGRLIKCASKC